MRLLPHSLWILVTAHFESQSRAVKAQQVPILVRKMKPDAGEKFHHEYWAFADQDDDQLDVQEPLSVKWPHVPCAAVAARPSFAEADVRIRGANALASREFRPVFLVHRTPDGDHGDDGVLEGQDRAISASYLIHWRGRAAEVLTRLQRRDWSCPTRTSSCVDIGYPNSCCAEGQTCVVVQDAGLGPVGCCPAGSTCGGAVTSCDAGATACPSTMGGGCCIAGYVCAGVGCVLSRPSMSTSAASVVTLTTTSISVITSPSPITIVVTVVITETPSQPAAATSTSTQITPPRPGPTETTTEMRTSSITGTGTAMPPVRPTSYASGNSYCPAGYYACLASVGGGCCQTGRDCQTRSCPPLSYTTIVETNGVTVVVPAAASSAASATCATGWFLCGSDAGLLPGCCPSGYSCGTASCTLASAGATATLAKELPGSGAAPQHDSTGRLSLIGVGVVAVLLFAQS